MPMLPDFRLETYFSRWEFTARYHLTASDAQTLPGTETPPTATEAAARSHVGSSRTRQSLPAKYVDTPAGERLIGQFQFWQVPHTRRRLKSLRQ